MPTAPMIAPPPRREDSVLLLALTASLSLVLHALLAFYLGDRPIGRVDPTLLGPRHESFQVLRSERDLILEEPMTLGAAGPEQPRAALADMAEALLHSQPPAPTRAAALSPASEALRPTPESRPVVSTRASSPVELPEAVTRAVVDPRALELSYVPDAAAQRGQPDTDASGAPRVAQAALLGTGLTPAWAGLTPPVPMPTIADRSDIDRRPLDASLAPPPMDFAALALSDTLKVAVPEKLDDDFEYFLTTYTPTAQRSFFGPAQPADRRGYFRVDIRAKRTLSKLTTMPKDVVYVIDTSESIAQPWVDAAIAGVRDGLSLLNPGDRFNIVLFKENPAFLSAQGVIRFDEAALQRAQTFLNTAQSGGYTDVNAAVSRLLVRDVEVQRVYSLVLISDGVPTRGVMNTRELINLVTRDNDLAASIYCVGIGDKQNKALLDFLAYRNKGFSVVAPDAAGARATLRDLLGRLRYPLVKNVGFTVAGLDGSEVHPEALPTIHQGEQFSLFGRFNTTTEFTMRLSGLNGVKPVDFTFTRDLAQAAAGDESLARDWAFWKLHHLYNELLRATDGRDIQQQIREVSREYKLKNVYDDAR